MIAEVVDEQTSPDRMMGLWLMGKDEATNDFIDPYLPDWIDTLPGTLARKIETSDDRRMLIDFSAILRISLA